MPWIQFSKGLLKASCIHHGAGDTAVLVEKLDAGDTHELELTNVPIGALGVRIQASGRTLLPHFHEGAPCHRMCDSVFFLNYSGKRYILFIEMKSGGSGGIISQFKSSDALLCHLEAVIRLFSKTLAPRDRIERRFVLVKRVRLGKGMRPSDFITKQEAGGDFRYLEVQRRSVSLPALLNR